MYQLDIAKAKAILTQNPDIKDFDADLMLKDFPLIPEKLEPAVTKWLETQEVTDASFEGVGIKKVMKTRNCDFLTAVRDISRLADEKIPEEQRDKLKEILKHPVHYE